MLNRYEVADISKINFTRRTYFPQICNDSGVMGAGVAKAIANRYPIVKKQYHDWDMETKLYMADLDEAVPFKLGRNQFVKVESNLSIVNMIAQSDPGGYSPRNSKYSTGFKLPPIRYQSLEECLYRFREYLFDQEDMNAVILDFCIISPLFGCGLAGGKPKLIKDLVTDIFDDLHLTWTWISIDKDQLDDFKEL